jgi:hypothetical protein
MNNITNINLGLDSIAKAYIKNKVDPDVEPVVIANAGAINSIKLFKYKLIDGSVAEEFIQIILPSNKGQTLYFLALKTEKRLFNWPSEKILKKVSIYSVI